jgi:hypothetical protein
MAPKHEAGKTVEAGRAPAVSSAAPSAPRVIDPRQTEAWADLTMAWLTAPFPKKLAMARAFVEKTPALDSSIVLEIMLELVPAARRARKVAEIQALADLIARVQPQAYAEESFWFASWRCESALRGTGDLREPMLVAAREASARPEPFADLVDQLLFFCRGPDALAGLSAAWPTLAAALEPASQREQRRRGMLLAACAAGEAAHSGESDLRASVAPFAQADDESWTTALVALLVRGETPAYDLTHPSQAHASPDAVSLACLELALSLRLDPVWRGGRFVLAHDELVRYLARAEGRKAGKGKATGPASWFTRARLEAYLRDGMGMGSAPFRAAALAAALPTLFVVLQQRHQLELAEAWHLYESLRDPVIGLAGALAELTGELDLARAVIAAWDAAPAALAPRGDTH